jgi:hypothetical protein
MDERSARAWTESMAVRPLGRGRYAVDSQSGATYVVDLPASDCSCPDHEIRGERCKHLRRVAIEVNRGLVPPPGKLDGICRACGRPRFVTERVPHLCAECNLEVGQFARDRETGDLVVVARVTDRPADRTRIESADCTVAEYPKNEGYPPEDPVVEVVYPSALPHTSFDELQRYSFPLSRLQGRDARLVQ